MTMLSSTPTDGSPAALGYRMPAEWEPHAATWVAWPHNRDTWPGKFEPIPAIFEQLVRTLAQSEPVCVLAGTGNVMREARQAVGRLENVTLFDLPTNDVWVRDHGPTFLAGPKSSTDSTNASRALVDWQYNAWGGKYPPFDADNDVPRRVAERIGYRRYVAPIVLEGGAIDSNGHGTLLAAESCLLNPNRNPGRSRREIECFLADYLGARNVIWLSAEIVGDDTDGHVDQFARFVGPRTVLAAHGRDPADVDHAPLARAFAQLEKSTDQDGRPLEVIGLPMPRAIFHANRRLPASYVNFYLANRLILVPQFNDPADAEACETLARLFPDRRVVGLPAIDLAWGLGAFHCVTLQQPAVQ